MPNVVMNNERFLLVDGFIFVDPAESIRDRSLALINELHWSTDQIAYADQPEPEDVVETQPAWSICFELGLDHALDKMGDWRQDVNRLFTFLDEVQAETGAEFLVEVRFRSAPWYSLHVCFIDDSPRSAEEEHGLIFTFLNSPPKSH